MDLTNKRKISKMFKKLAITNMCKNSQQRKFWFLKELTTKTKLLQQPKIMYDCLF